MNKLSEILDFLGKAIFAFFVVIFVFYYKFRDKIRKFFKL
jgi:dsRNA-specific ribonuclease